MDVKEDEKKEYLMIYIELNKIWKDRCDFCYIILFNENIDYFIYEKAVYFIHI